MEAWSSKCQQGEQHHVLGHGSVGRGKRGREACCYGVQQVGEGCRSARGKGGGKEEEGYERERERVRKGVETFVRRC